jgi:hypothetical protein
VWQRLATMPVKLHPCLPGDQLGLLEGVQTRPRSVPAEVSLLACVQVGEGGLSLLFTWEGTQPDLEPMLFIRWVGTPGSR